VRSLPHYRRLRECFEIRFSPQMNADKKVFKAIFGEFHQKSLFIRVHLWQMLIYKTLSEKVFRENQNKERQCLPKVGSKSARPTAKAVNFALAPVHRK
jgi:hypothetical protein